MSTDASEVFWYRARVRPSGIWLPVVWIWMAAACRVGFDHDAAQDGASEMPPDRPSPKLLSCGSPPAFPIKIGAGSADLVKQIRGFAAVATDDGYYAFVLDLANVVHGFAYHFDGDQLVPRTENAAVRSDPTEEIGVVDTGEGLLLAARYRQPSDGTALVPLTPDLQPRGTPYLNAGWFILPNHTLARSSDGTIALAGHPEPSEAVIEPVSALGVPRSSPHEAFPSSESAPSMVLEPAGPGFVITWQVSADIAGLRARVLDSAFQVKVAAITLNPDQKGNAPSVAYAPSVDNYLFAWFFKETNGNDDLWISLRNGNLEQLSRAQLSKTGTDPRIAVGGKEFLVVWRDGAVNSKLSAATASWSDASRFTPRPVLAHGGQVLDFGWDVVSRAGQAALAWLESTDTQGTVTLRFDALCD